MNQKLSIRIFTAAGIIGLFFGVAYAFWGLGILPVQRDVLVPWGNGVYGATFLGLSAVIFFVGRRAFETNDAKLMQALLYSLFFWLIIEFLFSIYYGVLFNAGVDIVLMILFGGPLWKGIRRAENN